MVNSLVHWRHSLLLQGLVKHVQLLQFHYSWAIHKCFLSAILLKPQFWLRLEQLTLNITSFRCWKFLLKLKQFLNVLILDVLVKSLLLNSVLMLFTLIPQINGGHLVLGRFYFWQFWSISIIGVKLPVSMRFLIGNDYLLDWFSRWLSCCEVLFV